MYFSVKEIDVPTLHTLRDQALLVDVRGDAEVAQGVIEGATHIPLHLLPLRAHEFAGDKPVVFYCRSGARSAQACAFMASRGVDNVFNLQGGILSWVNHGQDLSSLARAA